MRDITSRFAVLPRLEIGPCSKIDLTTLPPGIQVPICTDGISCMYRETLKGEN